MKSTKHILLLAALLLGSLAASAQNEDLIDIASNADVMLYTNAPCTNTTYGDQFVGWHVLFDNDPNTFFHSEYSDIDSEDGLDHYLRVDLGEGNDISIFAFTYTTRGNDASYTPTRIVVEGSNTANGTYTEIAVLTDLPREKGVEYQSSVLGNGMAYRYIRYRVTETVYNGKVKGHPYFYFAEFGMMKIMEGISAMGSCGDNLSWKLTDENELIIEGAGKMYDYPNNSAPWNKYRASIQTITMGEGVTSIGEKAFSGCTRLTAITLPESVTSIGNSAFYSCSRLNGAFISAETPPTIGTSVFPNNSFYIYVPASSVEAYKSAEGWSGYNNIQSTDLIRVDGIWYEFITKAKIAKVSTPTGIKYAGSISIPATVTYEGVTYSVTSIGEKAFYEFSGLTAITLPEGVTSIGDWAFHGCSGLTAITLPESVTRIGNYACQHCSSLTTITIPEGVTSIGGGAFWGCSSLTSITIPESVTSIGSGAFGYCSSLTSITIPESVTSIGFRAFEDCISLTTITIPENSQLTSIEYRAFYGCSSLTSITLPESVTSIGYHAFYGCSSFTSITIPEGVTSIESSAFSGCSSLTAITIPEGVTSIGESAFEYCSSLTSITIPEGVTSIESSAFSDCSSLTAITLPESVTSIGYNAFKDCSSLTSIVLPENLKNVGSKAFANCTELLDVYCYADSAPSASSDAFDGSYPEYITLHVSSNALESYKTTAPWSSFGTIVALGASITDITLSQSSATLYEGESLALTAAVTPDNATDKTVAWSSSDESVATVNTEGQVTAIAVGNATITATANDGSGVSASCEVVVTSIVKVEINGICYNLTPRAKQAEVTYKGDSYDSYFNEYSGSITISHHRRPRWCGI